MIKQVAALPYRFADDGKVEIMLVTSKQNRSHWIPPKGNLMAGVEPHKVAAQEAYEEAGVVGKVSSNPLGNYHAVKSNSLGETRPLNVTLFPMRCERHESDWPERGQRDALWFELESAVRMVREPELAALIERFRPRH